MQGGAATGEVAAAQAVWTATEDVLRDRIPAADYFSWFAMAEPAHLDDSTLVLSFANEFAVRWVRDRFSDVLRASVELVVGRPIDVVLVSRETAAAGDETQIEPAPTEPIEPMEAVSAAPEPATELPAGPESFTEEQLRAELGLPRQLAAAASQRTATSAVPGGATFALNPRYRFDTFVIGEANQLAHAAALSVAEAPGQSYNPLFIYGGTGLGKTHLLHAIGHYAQETQPGTTVAYVTTEEFVNRFIAAIQRRDQSRERFKEYFRGIDILLMDDVQFLSGKGTSMQEELFHTFNALHESGRQVVLTSDREPSSIPQLEDRLRSRFAWGLIADIGAPDHSTRVAILRKKAQFDRIEVPADVLDAIAERVTSNVRELEGALTRVVGYASLSGHPLSVSAAARVLDSYVSATSEPVTIDRIQAVVCDRFRLSHDDLVGARRSNDVAQPRQIAMYLARVLLGAPSTHVGQRFGGRDHSTVLHAEKKIDRLIKEDREIFDLVEELTTTLRSAAGSVQHAR